MSVVVLVHWLVLLPLLSSLFGTVAARSAQLSSRDWKMQTTFFAMFASTVMSSPHLQLVFDEVLQSLWPNSAFLISLPRGPMTLASMQKTLLQMLVSSLLVMAHPPLLWEPPVPASTPLEQLQKDLPQRIAVSLQKSHPRDSIPSALVPCAVAVAMEAEEPQGH